MPEQNSAYGSATCPWPLLRVFRMIPLKEKLPTSLSDEKMPTPYPPDWEKVADLRVFRTTHEEWQKLIGWRTEMKSKGWRLLKVTSGDREMVAIFGRTKEKLLSASEGGE